MADVRREKIDMALFGPVPAFVRVSVRLTGITEGRTRAARALLARASGASAARPGGAEPGDRPGAMTWRQAYAAVGLGADTVPPHEALAAWASQPGGVPSLGALTDVVNAFALQHGVPVAAYDLAGVRGDLWLRPSRGVEAYVPLDDRAPEPPPINEIILADSADQVLARRWHGSAGRPAAVGPNTRDAIAHLDVLSPDDRELERLGDAFVRLVTGFVGGEAEVQRITRARPQAAWGR